MIKEEEATIQWGGFWRRAQRKIQNFNIYSHLISVWNEDVPERRSQLVSQYDRFSCYKSQWPNAVSTVLANRKLLLCHIQRSYAVLIIKRPTKSGNLCKNYKTTIKLPKEEHLSVDEQIVQFNEEAALGSSVPKKHTSGATSSGWSVEQLAMLTTLKCVQ